MNDCLFCKIVKHEIPSEIVYENENVLGFKDINPMAKDHFLFISKSHSKNINEMSEQDIISIYSAIKDFTLSKDLETDGFRVVTNVNKHGGQTVFHTHFHLLAGEQLRGFGA